MKRVRKPSFLLGARDSAVARTRVIAPPVSKEHLPVTVIIVLTAMFKANQLTIPWLWAALICFVWVGGTYSVGSLAQEHETTTVHFTPPAGCVADPRIAVAARAVQACIERFSPTHDFVVALRVRRYRPPPDVHVSKEDARQAVEEHVAELREAYGQGFFDRKAIPQPGQNYCERVGADQRSLRVPGYEGEDFRIAAEHWICARAYPATNTVELFDLESSERFRLATDDLSREFFDKAAAAARSVRFK